MPYCALGVEVLVSCSRQQPSFAVVAFSCSGTRAMTLPSKLGFEQPSPAVKCALQPACLFCRTASICLTWRQLARHACRWVFVAMLSLTLVNTAHDDRGARRKGLIVSPLSTSVSAPSVCDVVEFARGCTVMRVRGGKKKEESICKRTSTHWLECRKEEGKSSAQTWNARRIVHANHS